MSKGNNADAALRHDDAQRVRALLEEALSLLNGGHGRSPQARAKKVGSKASHTQGLSFALNGRAFMKKYGANLSGPKKFTLLLARLAHGKVGVDVSVKEIESAWNRMKGVMGPYNSAHSTRAKERGWLNSPKHGVYSLSDSWKESVEE